MVNADGTFEASGSGCGYDTPNDWAGGGYEIPGEYLTNNDESVSFKGIIDVSGRTSLDTDTVRVTFPTGGTVTAEVQDDGYFVTSVTGNVSLYNGTPTVEAAD